MLEEAKVEPRRSENVVVESTAKALAGQATTANAAAKNSSQGIQGGSNLDPKSSKEQHLSYMSMTILEERSKQDGAVEQMTDEFDEKYDEKVAPLPKYMPIENKEKLFLKEKPENILGDRYSFKADRQQIQNQIALLPTGSNFADQIIQIDKYSQNTSINNVSEP